MEEKEITPEIQLIDDLNNKITESNDKYLRLYAEFENYKKRVQKEREEIKNSTKVNLMHSILDMDSDLNIASKNIKDDDSRKAIEMIISKVDRFLKSHDIESIQTNEYDCDLHEVVSVINPGGTKIIDVVSKGYKINGSPFKYPKVILG